MMIMIVPEAGAIKTSYSWRRTIHRTQFYFPGNVFFGELFRPAELCVDLESFRRYPRTFGKDTPLN